MQLSYNIILPNQPENYLGKLVGDMLIKLRKSVKMKYIGHENIRGFVVLIEDVH